MFRIGPVKDWHIAAKLAAAAGTVAALVGLGTNLKEIAEAQPMATKIWVNLQLEPIANSLTAILWNQTIDRYNMLDYQIGQMRSQKIMLEDSIARTTVREDIIEKQVRLDALSHQLDDKITLYNKLRCQIEARSTAAAC